MDARAIRKIKHCRQQSLGESGNKKNNVKMDCRSFENYQRILEDKTEMIGLRSVMSIVGKAKILDI